MTHFDELAELYALGMLDEPECSPTRVNVRHAASLSNAPRSLSAS